MRGGEDRIPSPGLSQCADEEELAPHPIIDSGGLHCKDMLAGL